MPTLQSCSSKLRSLLKKAGEPAANDDLALLKDINEECFACQRFA